MSKMIDTPKHYRQGQASAGKLVRVLLMDADGQLDESLYKAFRETELGSGLMIRDETLASLSLFTESTEHMDWIASPEPAIILLRLDVYNDEHLQAVRKMKTHANWRRIVLIGLSYDTTPDKTEIAYSCGLNSLIRIPDNPQELKEMAESLSYYWLKAVYLPPQSDPTARMI